MVLAQSSQLIQLVTAVMAESSIDAVVYVNPYYPIGIEALLAADHIIERCPLSLV